MKRRILLALSPQDREWHKLLKAGLQTARKSNVQVDCVQTANAALSRIAKHKYALIMASLGLAGGERAPVAATGGIDLCEQIRRSSTTPLLLLLPETTDAINARCSALAPAVVPLEFGADLPERVIAQLEETARAPLLDILIYTTDREDWHYTLRAESKAYKANGKLQFPHTTRNLLVFNSKRLPKDPDEWSETFDVVGTNLIQQFCSKQNPNFLRHLRKGLEHSNGIENTRVSFVVERSSYDIALEAVKPPPPEPPSPWMVRAPLFRSIAGTRPATPELFREPKRLRALVICADASGYVDARVDDKGRAVRYDRLNFVARECRTVLELLQHTGVDAHAFPRTGLTQVKAVELIGRLEEGWDIVHIAGHSVYSIREDRGYLVIGKPGAAVEVDFADVAPFLRKAKLLYLSSCESTSAPFAMTAAKEGVAAVVGYRWPVKDAWGAVHAHMFYRCLFKHRSVETAFLRTRRAMYRKRHRGAVWASSMLVKPGH